MAVTRKVRDRGRSKGLGRSTLVFSTAGTRRAKRGAWIAAGILGAMLVAGAAYAGAPRKLPTRTAMPLEEAVDLAMDRLGASNPHTIAQLACSLAYPAGCTQAETKLVYDLVIARLGPEWAEIPPPTEPVHTPLVEQVAAWLSGLSQEQRDGLRGILGPAYYDPLVSAVESGDGVALDAEVIRLRALGEDLYQNDRLTALQKYAALQSLLGPKLNDLVVLFV